MSRSPRYTAKQKLSALLTVRKIKHTLRCSTNWACREAGINHPTYLRWEERYRYEGGRAALKPRYANCGRRKKEVQP